MRSLNPHVRLAALAAVVVGASTAANAQTRWAIYVMNVDGSDVKKVSRLEGNYCGSPNWAHDGKRLSFDAAPGDFDFTKSHIYVQTLGESTSLDLGPGNTPCFSPDDSQILFMVPNTPGAKKGVWVMNADGSGREWLSEGERPRWSPDGTKIVSTSAHEGFPSIYIFDTLTLEHTRVLDRGYDRIIGATWSPDGKELAYIGYKGGQVNQGKGELSVVMAAANQSPRVLHEGPVGWQPDWSPDGSTILFREMIGNQERVQLLPLDGGQPQMVPGQLSGRNGDAVWSPDGKQQRRNKLVSAQQAISVNAVPEQKPKRLHFAHCRSRRLSLPQKHTTNLFPPLIRLPHQLQQLLPPALHFDTRAHAAKTC